MANSWVSEAADGKIINFESVLWGGGGEEFGEGYEAWRSFPIKIKVKYRRALLS